MKRYLHRKAKICQEIMDNIQIRIWILKNK